MGLIWIIIEIAALILFPPLGIALILGKWIFWAVKKKILIDIYFIYILFLGVPQVLLWWIMGILHIIFINFGLNIFKFSLHWMELVFDNLHKGVEVVENYSKEAASFLLFWGTLVVVFIQPPLSGNLMENITTYGTIFGFIFVPLILGSAILNYIKGGKLAQAKQKAAGAAQKAAQGPQQVRGQMESMPGERGSAGDVAEGVHSDIEKPEAIAKGAGKAEGVLRTAEGDIKWIPGNVKGAIVKLVKSLPGGKAIVGGGEKVGKKAATRTVAKQGAEKAGMVAEGAESVSLLPAILIIILVAPILWGLQAAIIGGTFMGMVSVWMPMVAGPAMEAAGLGAAYGNWVGGAAANSEAGVALTQGSLFEEEKRAISQGIAKVQCGLKGPQCLRQWQMNNTVRPGSDSVGERYELTIENFGIGTDRIDTAYKEKGYTIPVNFLVSNTRNGLKGITARNVEYKIDIRDQDEVFCTTDWQSISSQGINVEDVEGLNLEDNILPGLGVSPVRSLDMLNLSACEMLQPSMGANKVMELNVRYDYSSQATLYFDAMSREQRRELGINPSFEKSETAKTPVQSYANVQQPVSFFETESGSRRGVPFSARFGFETPGFNVEYKIHPGSIAIYDSTLTEAMEENCNGLKHVEGNQYNISERAAERISARQQEGWFSSNVEPAPLRCTMQLTNPEEIDPAGEELIMRIDGNYTIKKTEQFESFSVWNTECSRIPCPMLVTKGYSDAREDMNLNYECTGSTSVDSRNGCSVRVPEDGAGEGDISWSRVNVEEYEVDGENRTLTIAQGTMARNFDNLKEEFNVEPPGGDNNYATNRADKYEGKVVGVPLEWKTKLHENGAGIAAFIEDSSGVGRFRIRKQQMTLCRQQVDEIGSKSQAVQKVAETWSEKRNNDPVMVKAWISDCSEGIGQKIESFASCGIGGYFDIIGSNIEAGIDIATLNDPRDAYSDLGENEDCLVDAASKVSACYSEEEKGLLMSTGGDVRCWGGDFF